MLHFPNSGYLFRYGVCHDKLPSFVGYMLLIRFWAGIEIYYAPNQTILCRLALIQKTPPKYPFAKQPFRCTILTSSLDLLVTWR
jgi:hypothetical protein